MLTRTPQLDVDADANEPRRGTTAMEYLMMMSLIIVVALIGIGYFGDNTKNVTAGASSAISKAMNNNK